MLVLKRYRSWEPLETIKRCLKPRSTILLIRENTFICLTPFHWQPWRKASRQKLSQAVAIKRNSTSLSLAKKLLPRNCYLSGWHCCPNPNYNASFLRKKKKASYISFPISKYFVFLHWRQIEPERDLNPIAMVGRFKCAYHSTTPITM